MIDRKRAVNALASSERSAEASAILAGVVADLKETTQVRAAAAAQLSVMPKESAEKALMENLETANEIVRLEVRKSLTKIGSEKVVDDNAPCLESRGRRSTHCQYRLVPRSLTLVANLREGQWRAVY